MIDWRKLTSRVKVGGALPVKLTGYDEFVKFSMTVPCVKTGEATEISMVMETPPNLDEAHALAWIRETVHLLYRHEADEQIRVDDAVLFRPWHEHAGGQ